MTTKSKDAKTTTRMPDGLAETIAMETLGLATLKRRNSDRLDFHDLAVWTIREALEAAYQAGKAAGAAAPTLPSSKEVMADLVRRHRDEGFFHGYLGHSARTDALDLAVLSVLSGRGFDLEDAYQALNSRNGRHLGDALSGARREDWGQIVAENLWLRPAQMYAAFGVPKAAKGAALKFRAGR